MITVKTLPEPEYFLGHKACGGCGGSLVIRWVLKVLGERCIAVIPAGCMSAVGFIYPQMAIGVNAIIAPFAATGAMASGVSRGLRARGQNDVQVVAFAGDGATADIGLQALSGAFDRRERILYICYDNEAYMNTGIQKSGATPFGAGTTTSPGGYRPELDAPKKDLIRIAAAHGIPYAATATVGHANDFLSKVQKASQVDGPAFLHVFAPCPTGWGCESDSAIRLGKSVVATGLWPLLEWEQGRLAINRDPRQFAPLESYTLGQARFRALTAADLTRIEGIRDRHWQGLRAWAGEHCAAPGANPG